MHENTAFGFFKDAPPYNSEQCGDCEGPQKTAEFVSRTRQNRPSQNNKHREETENQCDEYIHELRVARKRNRRLGDLGLRFEPLRNIVFIMLKPDQVKHLLDDLLFTHKQVLLHGNLHRKITTELYRKNAETWNTLLLSLEAGIIVGLQRILERKDFFGREFDTPELNNFAEKIENIRNDLIAHINLAVAQDKEKFLSENRSTGSEIIRMLETLKSRAIEYDKAYKLDVDVHARFVEATRAAMTDLEDWLKWFK